MPTTSLRPALAALAAAPRSTTVRKLWKALTAEERAAAITASLADDENGWVKTTTRTAVAGALKFRPQTVGTWPRQKLVAEAARLPLDDVQLLSAFLVDLHLGTRRPMMAAFLDSVRVKHENGRLHAEARGPLELDADQFRAAPDVLVRTYRVDGVVTYFAPVLLQDYESWKPAV